MVDVVGGVQEAVGLSNVVGAMRRLGRADGLVVAPTVFFGTAMTEFGEGRQLFTICDTWDTDEKPNPPTHLCWLSLYGTEISVAVEVHVELIPLGSERDPSQVLLMTVEAVSSWWTRMMVEDVSWMGNLAGGGIC